MMKSNLKKKIDGTLRKYDEDEEVINTRIKKKNKI